MSKGETTKTAILERASKLASAIGLEALTIGNLAAAMEMSKSGLFAHFGSKENLQLEVLRYSARCFLDDVVRPAFQQAPGEPRVLAIFEYWLRWVKANQLEGGCLFIQSATEFDDQPGPVRDCLEYSQREWLDGLAESARRAVAINHFRSDLDAEQFAFEFYALLLGYHNSQRMLRDPRSEDRVRKAIAGLLAQSRHPDYHPES